MSADSEFPGFYDPSRVGRLYAPDVQAATLAGHRLRIASGELDRPSVLLLLVDAQVDFIHADGALSVPGAIEDTRRTIEWIFRHADHISHVAASLDSHIPIQIFYAGWWSGEDGSSPTPYTVITADQVEAGVWRPQFQAEWSLEYVHKLEQQAKKQLMIWPYHTMIGTIGHAITPALFEAIAFHSAASGSSPRFVSKGTLPQTEYYSLFEPEVQVPEDPQGVPNQAFMNWALAFERIYVAGQAKSHCVLETLRSLVRYHGQDLQVMRKVHVLMDCTSSVQHPEIDFESMAEAAFQDFVERGIGLTRSTEPLD